MPLFTIVITDLDGLKHTSVCEYPSALNAINEIGRLVSPNRPHATLERGSGDSRKWTGAWYWDGQPRWRPEKM